MRPSLPSVQAARELGLGRSNLTWDRHHRTSGACQLIVLINNDLHQRQDNVMDGATGGPAPPSHQRDNDILGAQGAIAGQCQWIIVRQSWLRWQCGPLSLPSSSPSSHHHEFVVVNAGMRRGQSPIHVTGRGAGPLLRGACASRQWAAMGWRGRGLSRLRSRLPCLRGLLLIVILPGLPRGGL